MQVPLRSDRFDLEDFITYFMSHYLSAGINRPEERLAYGRPYTITEFRNSYRIAIGNNIKRFSTLYACAEFIYKSLFDFKRVYLSETPYKKIARLQSASPYVRRKYTTELVNCLKGRTAQLREQYREQPFYKRANSA